VEWRDANGTFVGPVIVENTIIHFDARGLLWIVGSDGQFQFEGESVYYDAVDCMGNAYVADVLPRLVFKADGDAPDTYRALPDAYTLGTVQVRSVRDGSGCRNSSFEDRLLPLAESLPATPIVKPAVQFVGPLRVALK
jgi:hypothetical protein